MIYFIRVGLYCEPVAKQGISTLTDRAG